jgi:hypothetical protein
MKNPSQQDASLPALDRRRFLIRASTGAAGIALLPMIYEPNLIAMPSPGFASFLKRVAKFALKVGLGYLGINPQDALNTVENRVRQEVDRRLETVFERGYKFLDKTYGGRDQMLTESDSQHSTLLIPMEKPQGGTLSYVVPVLNVDRRVLSADANREQVLGSVISTPTMHALPDVADDIENNGRGESDRHLLLVPKVARNMPFNGPDQELYVTGLGSLLAERREYKPEDNSAVMRFEVKGRIKGSKTDRTEHLLFTGSRPGKEYQVHFAQE